MPPALIVTELLFVNENILACFNFFNIFENDNYESKINISNWRKYPNGMVKLLHYVIKTEICAGKKLISAHH